MGIWNLALFSSMALPFLFFFFFFLFSQMFCSTLSTLAGSTQIIWKNVEIFKIVLFSQRTKFCVPETKESCGALRNILFYCGIFKWLIENYWTDICQSCPW
jgi:hypothetical protein